MLLVLETTLNFEDIGINDFLTNIYNTLAIYRYSYLEYFVSGRGKMTIIIMKYNIIIIMSNLKLFFLEILLNIYTISFIYEFSCM